jgi:hypothetical protein
MVLPCTLYLLPCTSVADAATVTIAWDKNSESDVVGYRMHYGIVSDSYDYSVDVGNFTSCSISGLKEGTTYYFAATAYNSNNIESSPSVELAHMITVANTDGGGTSDNDQTSPAVADPDDSDTGSGGTNDGISDGSEVDNRNSSSDPGSNLTGEPYNIESFEAYVAGENPVDWLDTAAKNSMREDDRLFKVFDLGGEKVFGTKSTKTNIHSHYSGTGIETAFGYEYTGRMMMTAAKSGIGVTFFSQYPNADAYYRLRRYNNKSFHIAPHPDGKNISGDTDTGLVPVPNKWYRFRVRVEDTGSRTEIKARVWADGKSEPADWQIDAWDDSGTRLTEGTFGVWSYSSGSKYWDDLAVEPMSIVSMDEETAADNTDNDIELPDGEDSSTDAAGDNYADWLDTAANNSMTEDDRLFQVYDLGGDAVFGTTSTQTNIHSHYFATEIDFISAYEYTGRMMMTAAKSGIGVTFFSQYPSEDAYYRLRRHGSNAFHIAPHPDGKKISGDTDTGVVPVPNKWYRFKVQVEDTGSRTEIRAKVWPDGTAEPSAWQVNAYDGSVTRLTEGTIGVWSYSSGSKYWDDLAFSAISF